MGGFEVVIEWMRTNMGVALAALMYIGAAGVMAFGLTSAVSTYYAGSYSSGRDLMTTMGYYAIGAGALFAGATFVPTLLG